MQPLSSDTKREGIVAQNAVQNQLEDKLVTAFNRGQTDLTFSDPNQKLEGSLSIVTGASGAGLIFQPKPIDTAKLGNAENFDFEKMSHALQSQVFPSEPVDAGNDFGADKMSNKVPVAMPKGQLAGLNFDPKKWKSPAPATVATDKVNATGSIANASHEE